MSTLPGHTRTVVVAAAVIERDGRFLVTRRLEGTHLAGTWEFPGGKCAPGETLPMCVTREIFEELGVDCRVGDEVFQVAHDYPDRRVELHFFACDIVGDPQPLLGQEMQWVARRDLGALEFPPADAELISRITADTTS